MRDSKFQKSSVPKNMIIIGYGIGNMYNYLHPRRYKLRPLRTHWGRDEDDHVSTHKEHLHAALGDLKMECGVQCG